MKAHLYDTSANKKDDPTARQTLRCVTSTREEARSYDQMMEHQGLVKVYSRNPETGRRSYRWERQGAPVGEGSQSSEEQEKKSPLGAWDLRTNNHEGDENL